MSTSPHVRDVSESEFDEAVLAESHTRPVVVDFWAPWCGPCRALGPVLERLADEAAGAFLLVKINTDDNPEVARRMRIRGIPAVKAFVDGKLAHEFTGALPEESVRQFLRAFLKSPGQRQAEDALRMLRAGDAPEAERLAKDALALDPRASLAWVVRAEAALSRGELEEAEALADQVSREPDLAELREPLEARLELTRRLRRGGDAATLAERAAAGDDPDVLLALAAEAALGGDAAAAFERALGVLGGHRATHKEPTHAVMLAIIRLATPELARDLRRRLSIALY